MSKIFFEGWYFKHQNKSCTVSVIPGISTSGAFIQIITNEASYNVDFPKEQFSQDEVIKIGKNIFSFNGISLDIKTREFNVEGELIYRDLTPLDNDIMGPFRFLPMICRHGIISMHHKVEGQIKINGEIFKFTDGTGYIEKDSGNSFPKRYVWVQSNDFNQKCSVMAAIADVPFCRFQFKGVICAIHYKEKEYKISTYNGGKILRCTKEKIIIANKTLRLDVSLLEQKGLNLNAPINGKMTKIIKEVPSCSAKFKFFENNTLIFDMTSTKTSCEFVDY